MAYLGYNGLGTGLGTGLGVGLGVGYGGLGYGGLGYGGLGYGGLGYFGDGIAGGTVAGIAANERLTIGLGNQVQNFGLANIASTERNGEFNQQSTQNFGLINLLATQNNGRDNLAATIHNGGHISAQIAHSTGKITKNAWQIANQQNILATQFNTANIIAQKDAQLQLAQSTNVITLQASNNKNDIQKDIAESKSFFALLSAQQSAAAQLQAEQNNTTTNAHIAECCCRTESKIVETGNKTDTLILALDNAKIKEQLALQTTINLINQARNSSGNFA
jgi:hypothetical protein